jgi:hypothetical protein
VVVVVGKDQMKITHGIAVTKLRVADVKFIRCAETMIETTMIITTEEMIMMIEEMIITTEETIMMIEEIIESPIVVGIDITTIRIATWSMESDPMNITTIDEIIAMLIILTGGIVAPLATTMVRML